MEIHAEIAERLTNHSGIGEVEEVPQQTWLSTIVGSVLAVVIIGASVSIWFLSSAFEEPTTAERVVLFLFCAFFAFGGVWILYIGWRGRFYRAKMGKIEFELRVRMEEDGTTIECRLQLSPPSAMTIETCEVALIARTSHIKRTSEATFTVYDEFLRISEHVWQGESLTAEELRWETVELELDPELPHSDDSKEGGVHWLLEMRLDTKESVHDYLDRYKVYVF